MSTENMNKRVSDLESRVKQLENDLNNSLEVLAVVFEKSFLTGSTYDERLAAIVEELGNMEGPKLTRISPLH